MSTVCLVDYKGNVKSESATLVNCRAEALVKSIPVLTN